MAHLAAPTNTRSRATHGSLYARESSWPLSSRALLSRGEGMSTSNFTIAANTNTTEAVDALVEDLMTRLQMVDLDISYRKLADFQYKIGEKKYHLRNINGRLFTRKGGGYQDLLVVLTSFLRF